MIKDCVEMLEALEKQAGEEGWGGEFREEMFDLFLSYFVLWKGRKSIGSLLNFLCGRCAEWFVVVPTERQKQ